MDVGKSSLVVTSWRMDLGKSAVTVTCRRMDLLKSMVHDKLKNGCRQVYTGCDKLK